MTGVAGARRSRPLTPIVNDVQMKEYVDTLVLALRREMDQRQVMNSQAIEAAASALNHRLEGMNEFRTQITSERGEYVRMDTFRWIIGTFFLGLLAIGVTLAIAVVRRGSP